jgi:hypothetical protein
MTAMQSDRPSYRLLLVMVAVALGVYAWYAVSQYDRLNELNHRQLSNGGAELKIAIDDAVVTVKEFNRKWDKSDRRKPAVCSFVKAQPYLELDGCEPSSSPDDVKWSSFGSVQPVADSALAIKVAGVRSRPGASDEAAVEHRFRYRTDKLLQELAFSDSFGLIFVATDKGVVLYEDAPMRRQWLRHLRWGEQTFRDAHVDRPPTVQIHNVQQLVGGADPWNQLRSVSSRTTVSLGGVSHQLYLQPLVLDGDPSIRLIIGGVVPRMSVVRDAMALGTSAVGVMVFLLLLGLLGVPFVKLAVLDRRERFRRRDVVFLYASSGALLVLFTCASLAVDGYVRWHVEADQGLQPFAMHLEERFRAEVTDIRNQLLEYDQRVSALTARDCERWAVHTNWFEQESAGPEGLPWPRNLHLRTVAWIEPGGWQIWKSTADAIPGKSFVGHRVYFRAVRDDHLFQVDRHGGAIFLGPDRSIADGKFYTFVSMRSNANISKLCSERQNASGDLVVATTAQLLSLDRQPLPTGYGFALVNREGRVLYHSDGRLSLRENLFEELAEGSRARAMMYAGSSGGLDTRYRERPHRFYFHQVGLFRDRSHTPNAPIDPTQVSLPPVDSAEPDNREPAGFYLAVFRDTSVERALLGHVFVVGLLGPIALLCGVTSVMLAFLCYAARRRHHSWIVWLWPHRGLEHIYQTQSAVFLALLLMCAGIYIRYDSMTLFILAPFLAIVLGIGIYAMLASRQGARTRLSTPIWQRSAVFLVVVCMIVVPSAALFRVALSHEFAKLILTEQQWIAAQQDDLPRTAKVEALNERYAKSRARDLLNGRQLYVGCVPAPFDAIGPQYPPNVPGARGSAVVRAAYAAKQPRAAEVRSPFVSCGGDASTGTGNALLPSATAGTTVIEALHWLDDVLPINNEVLVRQHFQRIQQAYSPSGTIVRWFKASEIALVGFAITLALLLWWIGWNTNRLFLADLDEGGSTPSGTFARIWDRCTLDEQMVLVHIARERIANPYQRPVVEALLKKGLLRFNPEVQPFSDAFDDFLRSKEQELAARIEDWEKVNACHSWRYGRMILAASIAGIGFFLVATQPGLQFNLVGVASGITGILTAGFKFRDAVSAWFGDRRSPS